MEAENAAIAREPVVKELLRTARNAALAAGAFQLQHFACSAKTVTESSAHDLKLKIDQTSEKIVMDIIFDEFPEHAILSEEKGLVAGRSDYIWIIDPLDGTVNYYFGLPLFCVCVACYRVTGTLKMDAAGKINGLFNHIRPLVGVVYAPMLNRLYCAAAGGGATWNDRRILPSADIALKDAIVGISFGSDETTMAEMEIVNTALVRQVKKVRIFGASGLDLAHVAMGSMGALVQKKVRSWDIAAALVILQESGCRVMLESNADGSWQIIAGHPALFEPLKEIVNYQGSAATRKPRLK